MAELAALTELQQSSFFRGFPEKYMQEVTALCRPVEFPPNTKIFEEYGQAKEVYIILSGTVSLAICEPDVSCRQIALVSDGELIGWSPLVGRSRLSDTAHSTTNVRAYVFDGEELMKFCRANPEFGFEFMHRAASVLADRLSGTRMQLMKMCGFDMPKVQVESD